MASRKDFGQPKSKGRRAASKETVVQSKPAKPSSVKPLKVASLAVAPRRLSWPLLLASIFAAAALVYGLLQLINVDPRGIRESALNDLIAEKTPARDAQATTTSPIKQKPTNSAAQNTAVIKAKPVVQTTQTPPVEEKSTKAVQKEPYQFYKILAEDSVETEEISSYKSTPKTAKLNQTTLLQTGSFRNQNDADRMKARLLLNNLPNVFVGKVSTANGVWYRVRTGPFKTYSSLKTAQQKLSKMSIFPIKVKIP